VGGGFRNQYLQPNQKEGSIMKRLVLHVALMLVTFAFGVGLDRLLWEPHVEPLPNLEVFPLPEPRIVHSYGIGAPAAESKEFILDYDFEKFNPVGAYEIMGPKPKAFANFQGIELAVSGSESYPGYIVVYNEGSYNEYDGASATFALVTDERVFFVTSKTEVSLVEYRFDGKFLRRDFASVGGKNKAVLRGTLTKTKNGLKIAEHTFDFRMYHLGC
jgi:hypothetical protein